MSASLNITEFFSKVQEIKEHLGVRPSSRSNDQARRRIVLAITEAFLECIERKDDAHQDYFFEANLYHALKQTNLSCTGVLPEEERLMNTGKFGRSTGDALKLVSEGLECTEEYPLVTKILEILQDERDIPIRTANIRERTDRFFRNQRGPVARAQEKRITLCAARER